MAIIHDQPKNLNILNPSKFRFVLQRAPSVVFWAQSATIPSLALGIAKQASPFQTIVRPGSKIEYELYPLKFKVSEDMTNYLEIFDWMNNLGFTEDFEGYKRIEQSGQSLVSDSTLIIETAKNNPNIEVIFRDMFPVGLSELEFDTTGEDIRFLDATVTFAYQRFTVRKLVP